MTTTQKQLRDAFIYGFKKALIGAHWHLPTEDEIERMARIAYPPKMVTRPRIVRLGDCLFRIFENRLQWTTQDHPNGWADESDTMQAAFELGQNPIEMVEDEE